MGMDAVAKLTHGFHLDISPERFARVVLVRELTEKEKQDVEDCDSIGVLEGMVKELGLDLTVHLLNDGGDPRFIIGSEPVTAEWDEPKHVALIPTLTPEQVLKCEDIRTKLFAQPDDYETPPSIVALWLTADFC